MKGTSKIIMGATLTMLLSLAIVLGLVLVLLAQLYCSLLLRRRHLRKTTTTTTSAAAQLATNSQHHPTTPTLSSFYAQGVLHAPRNFLFPAVFPHTANNNIKNLDLETQNNSELPQKPHEVGLMFSSTPPSPAAFIPMASPKLVHGEDGGAVREDCVYICNPIYDLEANLPCRAVDTPFETPDSSPSRLSGFDDNGGQSACCSPASSVALTPMKQLPAKACSVSLKDASSLGTSRSDSVSNNDGVSSSSSSCSPSTSSCS